MEKSSSLPGDSLTPSANPADSEAQKKPSPLSTGKNMLWNSCGSIINLGLQWLITVVVVRLSSNYEAAGVLSLGMSVYNIFAPFAIYRMYTYQVSDVKRENALGEYFAFRIITCLIAFASCLVYAFLTCAQNAWLAIALFAAFKIVGLLIDVLHGEDQLNGRMDYIGKSLILQGLSTFIAFCLVFQITQSLEFAIFGMLVAATCVGLLFDLPHTKKLSAIKIGISKRKTLHLLAYCLPITLATIACSAVPSIPRQYLAFAQGNELLGAYASVAAPVAVIQMGASYIYNPLLSIFAKHNQTGDVKAFRKLFAQGLVGIIAIGILCAAAFQLMGPWLLTVIFGSGIEPYTYLLLPIVLLSLETAYIWFINDLLVALRVFGGSLIGNVAALAVAVVVTFPLVDCFGMNGVSFAGIVAFGACAIIMTAFLFPFLSTHCQKKRSD